jgi:16S rRNA (uracil1498-N3)-methyltransferase
VHRFFLPPDQCKGDSLILEGGEAHHALRVLRVRSGESVTVLDGRGLELVCVARQSGKDALQLTVTDRRTHPKPSCTITLLQAIPKGRLMDSIVQKSVELGVGRIVPLVSERVVADPGNDGAARKADRWRQTAVEAIKQCGNPWLPEIESPATPAHFLKRRERFDLHFIGSLQPGTQPMGAYVTRIREQPANARPLSAAVWVGPEGDFSPAEIESIIAAGALPITLGPLVLRSDTAAVCSLSILIHELLRWPGVSTPTA